MSLLRKCCCLVLILVTYVSWSDGCSCVFAPGPIEKPLLCGADFVIRTKVLSEIRPGPGEDIYNGYGWYRIRKPSARNIFKLNTDINKSALRKLYTRLSDGMCGVSLQKGQKYIIAGSGSGDRLSVMLCSSLVSVSPPERSLARMLWRLKRDKLNC